MRAFEAVLEGKSPLAFWDCFSMGDQIALLIGHALMIPVVTDDTPAGGTKSPVGLAQGK